MRPRPPHLGTLASTLLFLVLTGCSSLPPAVALAPDLDGPWTFVGGWPDHDPVLPWSRWPDRGLVIDAPRGRWVSTPVPGREARAVLPPVSRIVAVEGPVLTLAPEPRGRTFQIYYRLVDDRLEFWWGDHPDWLKPHVTYQRVPSP